MCMTMFTRECRSLVDLWFGSGLENTPLAIVQPTVGLPYPKL